MLAVYLQKRISNPALVYLVGIGLGAALTALAARVVVPLPFTPVPITLQVLAVLLAGLALGARGGALSQLAYLAAITAGLPLDAKGLGTGVWSQPTAGYLLGFVGGAFVTGWLAECGLRRNIGLRLAAGLAGVIVVYAVGTGWLTMFFLSGDWGKGWALGVGPFIVVDLVKALIAGAAAEGLRAWLWRGQPDLDRLSIRR